MIPGLIIVALMGLLILVDWIIKKIKNGAER